MRRPDALYLSPHLDDAVLSCGGTIHQQTEAAQHVVVLTVFTADLEDDPSNRLLQQVYGRMGLAPSEAMAARRDEDVRACGRLGAEPVHWNFDEALGRHRDLPSLEAVFQNLPASDDALVDQLAECLSEFENVPDVAAPLGLGGHIDHRIVRCAAAAVFGSRLRLYEDFPYILSVDDLERSDEVQGLLSHVRRVGPEDVKARIEAIAAYGSQIGSLFGSRLQRLRPGQGIGAKVRRRVRSVGGERFWSTET